MPITKEFVKGLKFLEDAPSSKLVATNKRQKWHWAFSIYKESHFCFGVFISKLKYLDHISLPTSECITHTHTVMHI